MGVTLRYSAAAEHGSNAPERTLTGIWREVAEAIDAGETQLAGLVDRFKLPGLSRTQTRHTIKSIAGLMVRLGLLDRSHSHYALTPRGRAQLPTPSPEPLPAGPNRALGSDRDGRALSSNREV